MSRSNALDRLSLSYLGLDVTVIAHDHADNHWLREFLSPWFRCSDKPTCLTLTVSRDDHRHRRLCDEQPWSNAQYAPCFTLDTANAADYPVLNDDRGGLVVRDDKLRAFYILDHLSGIRVISSGGAGYARVATMRVVREIATLHAWQQRAVLFHAAAVEIAGRVILIAGKKGAGKTTLLLSALRLPESRLLSNDRVFLISEQSILRALGMPTIVSIKPWTVEKNLDLEETTRQCGFRHIFAISECKADPEIVTSNRNRHLDITPAQLCAALGRTAVAEGSVAAVIWPQIATDVEGPRIQKMTAEETRHRLPQGLYPWSDRQGVFGPLVAPKGIDPRKGIGAVERSLVGLPNFLWRIEKGTTPDAWTSDTVRSVVD